MHWIEAWSTIRAREPEAAELEARLPGGPPPGEPHFGADRMTADSPPVDTGRGRRLATWLHRRPRMRLAGLLAAPLAWIGLAYLGSLAILLLNAFWVQDSFSGKVDPQFHARVVRASVHGGDLSHHRRADDRDGGGVTLTDVLLAFPIAYYMARIASPAPARRCWSSRS